MEHKNIDFVRRIDFDRLDMVVSESGSYCVMVGNNCIARYDQQSDDYAYTHARNTAEKWNAEA